jgi:[ribosomal protein S5]-alanine N-acetyltransferase
MKPAIAIVATELTTPRLKLRQLVIQDAPVIAALRSDLQVNRYIDRPLSITIGDALDWILKRQQDFADERSVVWAICESESGRLIGTICLWNFSKDRLTCETGYELFPESHGKGYMSEALGAVVDFARTSLGVKIVEAFTHSENERSTRVLLKHGFIPDDSRIDDDNLNNRIFVKTL